LGKHTRVVYNTYAVVIHVFKLGRMYHDQAYPELLNLYHKTIIVVHGREEENVEVTEKVISPKKATLDDNGAVLVR